jgi:hypothetical protein
MQYNKMRVKIPKTANSPGIRHYRMGWGHYDQNNTVDDNIRSMQLKLGKLTVINEKGSDNTETVS